MQMEDYNKKSREDKPQMIFFSSQIIYRAKKVGIVDFAYLKKMINVLGASSVLVLPN